MFRPRHLLCLVLLAAAGTGSALAQVLVERVPTAPVFSLTSAVIVATTGLLVAMCVTLHYETLLFLSSRLLLLRRQGRTRMLYLVFALFTLHVVEIWLFGLGYSLLLDDPAYGSLHGAYDDTLLDYVYFSAVIFTTLGLGDLVPSGSIRFLVGVEGLVGFMLISWSAAFTYLEMERFWKR
jgi:Ion channel